MDSSELFLNYDLPECLIAQSPSVPRDSSRLLLVDRESGELSDHRFYELPELLRAGDLLVVNDSKVLPARLHLRRETGAAVELLLLEDLGAGRWKALARPLARLRPGERLLFDSPTSSEAGSGVRFVERRGSTAVVEVQSRSVLDEFGRLPLPPYIRTDPEDSSRYQTVYATSEGSAAAPTAGLHFTSELLNRCEAHGISIASLTLHVGIDTFRPLTDDDPANHEIHSEWFSVPEGSWQAVVAAKKAGRRVVSVGTTTTRVLETLGDLACTPSELTSRTSIYIRPPYEFQVVDAQITNFHLPRTTLLLMIGAFAGDELLRSAYAHAIAREYRFYSFGDAMLIV